MQTSDLIRILPEIILAVAGIVVMLLGAFQKQNAGRMHPAIALLGLLGAAGAIAYQYPWRSLDPAFGGMLELDAFSAFFHILFFLVAALVVLSSSEYVAQERLASGEYHALLLFATMGMGLMASSNDLIMIFIGLEISSLASYILVGFRRGVATSSESSLKYFLLGSFATAFLLYGIALMFGATGATNLTEIHLALQAEQNTVTAMASPQLTPLVGPVPTALVGLSIALLFVGFAFKVSAVPFQIWTPDVYQGAPTPVTAFLSTGSKAAAFAVFLRVFMVALEGSAQDWVWLLWVSGLLSMVLGNLAALLQTNIKRMLAYSSIAHAGYILVAFTAHSEEGVAAVMFYLAAYALMNIGAFAVVSHFGNRGERYVEMEHYAGLGYRAPLLAASMTVFLLSLIGIPLTGGFFGKFYIFRAALHADLVWLTVLGVLNSAIAAYYYLRVIVFMYMHPAAEQIPVERVRPAMGFVLIFSVAATFLLGIFPQAVLDFASQAAALLLENLGNGVL
ncbi:MAG: NADH-quinone oxidoreductase subunit N [Acidobacteria bacterium]|nr:NADH-quinone oxidoreductase subunit N [Acidobacteriota bacterium]